MRRLWLCFTVLLSACSLYPTMPQQSREELIALGRAEGTSAIDLADARDLVAGLRSVLADAAQSRHKTAIVLNEIVFYGTLIAVGGTVADSIAARNTGGGLAALGSVFSSHYQVSVQQTAMRAAVDKLDCVRDAIAPISPGVRQLFASDFSDTGDPSATPPIPDIRGKFDAVPGVTLRAVRAIEDKLRVALAGIALSTPTKDELATVFGKFIDAKKLAEDSATPQAPGAAMTSLQLAVGKRAAVGLRALSDDECQAPATLDKAARQHCEIRALASLTDAQLADTKRRFELAVRVFEETVNACIATP